LLHFNELAGSFITADSVDPTRVVSFIGNAQIGAGGKFNNELLLDGIGDYLEFSIPVGIGTQPFCVEMFGRSPYSSGEDVALFGFHRGASSLLSMFWYGTGNANNPHLTILGPDILNGNAPAQDNNTYRHYAVSINGTEVKIFINGVIVASSTLASIPDFGSSPFTVRIGNNTVNQFWKGGIDEFRFTVGDPVYTTGFTPPIAEFAYP
jgi:hypothetical protein